MNNVMGISIFLLTLLIYIVIMVETIPNVGTKENLVTEYTDKQLGSILVPIKNVSLTMELVVKDIDTIQSRMKDDTEFTSKL